MRKGLVCLALFFLCLLLVGATEKPESVAISPLSCDSAILKGEGGSETITLTMAGEWCLSSDAPWLRVEPTSGGAGKVSIVLTTLANESRNDRTGEVAVLAAGESFSFSVRQRVKIFSRKKAYSGRVTNGLVLNNFGTTFSWIYAVIPFPLSNRYQEISNLSAPGCAVDACPDGLNYYFSRKVQSYGIPRSGEYVIYETFDAEIYTVIADLSKITVIPEYDPKSEECEMYLKKERNGLIDPTNPKIATTAQTLWEEAEGDLLTYARKCFDWTHDNITYGQKFTGLHSIKEIMKSMIGDCGNFSSVFISLLRAKGIPARHIVMVNPKGANHIRAEFYIPAYGWIPADPTWGGANFGISSGSYIVVAQGINNVIKDQDGRDYTIKCLQEGYYYYWYEKKGSFSFTYQCSGLN